MYVVLDVPSTPSPDGWYDPQAARRRPIEPPDPHRTPRRPWARTCVLLAAAACTPAQEGDPRFDALVDYLVEHMEPWRVPGAQLVIVEEGRIAHSVALGVVEEGAFERVTPATRFRLGSVTKQFTATALLQLERQGRVDRHAPIGTYVPDFALGDGLDPSTLTLHRLMTHSSGLSGVSEQARCETGDIGIGPYLAEHRDELLLFSDPDVLYNYSNRGYDVAGLVAEAVTGKPFEQVVRDEVLGPAGLDGMAFDARDPALGPAATGHVHAASDGSLRRTEAIDGLCSAVWPSGGLVGSAEDLAAWEVLLLDRMDGAFDPAVWDALTGPQWPRSSSHYGYGISVGTYHDLPRLTHTGSVGGFRTLMAVFPEHDFGIALTLNSYAYTSPEPVPGESATGFVMERAVELFLDQTIEPAEVLTPGPEDLPDYVGDWSARYVLGEVSTFVQGDALWITLSEPEPYTTEMLPYTMSTWKYVDPEGAEQSLSWTVGADGHDYLVGRHAVARRVDAPTR